MHSKGRFHLQVLNLFTTKDNHKLNLRTPTKRWIFVFLTVSLASCGTTQYVVLRNVPKSPSFVVIPANNYLNQVRYANEIERALIIAGVKVVARPATKEVMTEKEVHEAEGIQESGAQAIRAADAKVTERYFAFDDITADYIVQTFASPEQVKITKRESMEILAVITSQLDGLKINNTSYSWSSAIHKTLENMGIPVFK